MDGPLLGTWMADALLSTMWLFLILKCYLKDRPSGLLHFSIDKQSKPACGGNLTDWSYAPLFNPHINPAPMLSLVTTAEAHFPYRLCLTWVASRVGLPPVIVPLFPISLPIEAASVEVTGPGPGTG